MNCATRSETGWRPTGFPESTARRWAQLVVDAGWAVPSWEPEWYGRGLSDTQSRIVAAEFAAVGAPGTGHDRANLFACTLHDAGTDEQKRRLIPPSIRGESKWCLLYSEPGAGSDLAGLRTRAERHGDEWVINGQKVWTSFAKTADYGMLVARTNWDVPKHQGISFFMLPMRQPGVEIRPIHQITGESEFNEVFIEDARVPAENLVGELNGGWSVLQTALGLRAPVHGRSGSHRQGQHSGREPKRPTCWSNWRGMPAGWTTHTFVSRLPGSTRWPRSTAGTPSARRPPSIAARQRR